MITVSKSDIELCAVALVNHVNESTGASVEVRQATNDSNFDYAMSFITELIKSNTSKSQITQRIEELVKNAKSPIIVLCGDYPEMTSLADTKDRLMERVAESFNDAIPITLTKEYILAEPYYIEQPEKQQFEKPWHSKFPKNKKSRKKR